MAKEDLIEALDDYFSKDKKFIDTSRIPLICQDIFNIHTNVAKIDKKLDEKFVTKEQFWPVKTVVYGLVSIALTALAGSVIYLAIKQ